jgi:hypothetical protein
MPKSDQTCEKADLQHLTRVRALSSEVAAALSAIEHNDLSKLQVAIANQERICNELATTKWVPSPLANKSPRGIQSARSTTAEQIHVAYVALAQINRVYGGVVKRSKRAVDLLSALYGNQGDGYCPESRRSENFQTLSCEV